MKRRKDEQANGRTGGRKHGRTERRTVRRTNGWKDGQKEGYHFVHAEKYSGERCLSVNAKIYTVHKKWEGRKEGRNV